MGEGRAISAPASVDQVIGVVSRLAQVSRGAIQGESRAVRVLQARLIVYGLSASEGHALAEIGRKLGRDHTTVASGVRRLEALLPVDARLRQIHDAAARYLALTAGAPADLRAAVVTRICEASEDELAAVARFLGVCDG